MRECLACEKQFDEGDLEQSNRKDIPDFKAQTYCSFECYQKFESYMTNRAIEAKQSGLINDEGIAIQSNENNPDVVRKIIGGLNIKLTNNNK